MRLASDMLHTSWGRNLPTGPPPRPTAFLPVLCADVHALGAASLTDLMDLRAPPAASALPLPHEPPLSCPASKPPARVLPRCCSASGLPTVVVTSAPGPTWASPKIFSAISAIAHSYIASTGILARPPTPSSHPSGILHLQPPHCTAGQRCCVCRRRHRLQA